jgi:hypothetical protein
LFIPLIFLKVIVKKTNANNHETPIYFHSRLLSRFLKGQDYGKVMGGFSAEISFESEGIVAINIRQRSKSSAQCTDLMD